MEDETSTGMDKQLKSRATMRHAKIIGENSGVNEVGIVGRKQGGKGGEKRGREGMLSCSRSPVRGRRGDCYPAIQVLHVDDEKEKERNPPSRWSESGEWSEF